jgi:hypothetical protein
MENLTVDACMMLKCVGNVLCYFIYKIEENENYRQTSHLQAGAHCRAALEVGPGPGGDARRSQIGGTAPRVSRHAPP